MVPLKGRLVKHFWCPYNRTMDKPKKPTGRPPKPEDEKLHRRPIYLTADLWEKIDKHGFEWLRLVIRRAKPPR